MQPSSTLRRLAVLATATAAGALALTAVATPAAAVPSNGGCAQVSIITARASTEAAGEGITGALVTQVVNASTQTVSRASVSYPATLNNYNNSSLQGINALKTQLTNLVNSCPNTKVVLMGYSQGAHVSTDVLGGGQGGSLGTATAPISASIGSHVVALVTFGNPRHVANAPFNLGTATRAGRFPQTAAQLQVLNSTYAGKIAAWCDRNDTFCDSGTSTNVHLTYLNRYQNAAANFVLGKIGG